MLNVALHNIRSLYNVGSIFRTASGAGFEHVYISGYTGAPPDRRIAKVALGAEEEIPSSVLPGIEELLTALSSHYVIALEQHHTSTIYSAIEPPRNRPVTVVLGEELFGLDDALLERADVIAELPMAGEKQSLNVANAFAVVAYEFSRKLGLTGQTELKSRQQLPPPRPGVLTGDPYSPETP